MDYDVTYGKDVRADEHNKEPRFELLTAVVVKGNIAQAQCTLSSLEQREPVERASPHRDSCCGEVNFNEAFIFRERNKKRNWVFSFFLIRTEHITHYYTFVETFG